MSVKIRNFLCMMILSHLLYIASSKIWLVDGDQNCNDEEECKDDIMRCVNGTDCNIQCQEADACQDTIMYGPTDAHFSIYCGNEDDNECEGIEVHAELSKSLTITCTDDDDEGEDGCNKMKIYCPINAVSSPGCIISNLVEDNCDTQLDIYAVHGIQDIEITGDNPASIYLHCQEQYQSVCTLSSNTPFSSNCASSSICDTYTASKSPTKSPINPTTNPTQDPTISSTTMTPSRDPTYNPTFDPTNNPTNVPSNDPTIDPSNQPTSNPIISTNDPSVDPTLDPTNNPTQNPTQTSLKYLTNEPTTTTITATTTNTSSEQTSKNGSIASNVNIDSNSSNGSTHLYTEHIEILIIIVFAFLFCCMCTLFVMCLVYTHGTKRQIELMKAQMDNTQQSIEMDKDIQTDENQEDGKRDEDEEKAVDEIRKDTFDINGEFMNNGQNFDIDSMYGIDSVSKSDQPGRMESDEIINIPIGSFMNLNLGFEPGAIHMVNDNESDDKDEDMYNDKNGMRSIVSSTGCTPQVVPNMVDIGMV